MKRLFTTLIITMFTCTYINAQNVLNNAADNIVGTYSGVQDGEKFKVKIVKLKDKTYRGQMIWMENDKDENGNKRLDIKNPDKSLRSTPCDQIVLFSGLKYDAGDKEWNGAKIYDPRRGIRAKLKICFGKDGRLNVRGSLLGIGETVYWNKIEK